MIFFISILLSLLFSASTIQSDSSRTIIPVHRQYVTWADETISTQRNTTISTLNGYTWFDNAQGSNPFGYAFSTFTRNGVLGWTQLDGSLHPRALNNAIFNNALKGVDTADKHHLFFDLTFGNESGDPGVWNATDKLTPNADRKGPDMLLNYQFNPNDKNTFKLNGHFFETAIDDIPQIKRLKTVLDGDNLTGLRMPILSSYGVDASYKYENKSFDYMIYGAISSSDNYEMNRLIGVELPQNLTQSLISTSLFWDMGKKAPELSIKTAMQSVDIRAIQNEIANTTDQKLRLQNYQLEINQPIGKVVRFGVVGVLESFDHTVTNDDYSKLATQLKLNGNRQILTLQYGFNGNTDKLNSNEYTSFKYIISNKKKTFIVELFAEKMSLPQFKVDASLDVMLNGGGSLNKELSLSPWLENYLVPAVLIESSTNWYTNHKVNLLFDFTKIAKVNFWYSNWDNQLGLFTNYQYNEPYIIEDRSLPVRNEIAITKLIPNLTQFGISLNTVEYLFGPSNNLGLIIGGQWLHELNSPANTTELQIQRLPFPSLQLHTTLTAYIQSDFQITFDIRFRDKVELTYLNGLENRPHGVHKNLSNVDLGTFRNSTNTAVFGNIHLTKIVGQKRPIAIFADLNNISTNGIVYHPFGAIDNMTLMTGIRLNIF